MTLALGLASEATTLPLGLASEAAKLPLGSAMLLDDLALGLTELASLLAFSVLGSPTEATTLRALRSTLLPRQPLGLARAGLRALVGILGRVSHRGRRSGCGKRFSDERSDRDAPTDGDPPDRGVLARDDDPLPPSPVAFGAVTRVLAGDGETGVVVPGDAVGRRNLEPLPGTGTRSHQPGQRRDQGASRSSRRRNEAQLAIGSSGVADADLRAATAEQQEPRLGARHCAEVVNHGLTAFAAKPRTLSLHRLEVFAAGLEDR